MVGASGLRSAAHWQPYLDGAAFAEPDAIREALACAGVTDESPVAAYCGSGLTAAHLALAGVVAGVDVTVFPGSWSQWSNTPGRPVATGPSPRGDLARQEADLSTLSP